MPRQEQLFTESDVKVIVEKAEIKTLFQPIVSVPTKRIVGFESFSQGPSTDTACPLPAVTLFSSDWSEETQLSVDRLCREKALQRFRGIHKQHPGMTLFLNFNAAVLGYASSSLDFLNEQVKAAGLEPGNVIVEASARLCTHLSRDVVDHYKKMGYALCIDDAGLESPFFDVIAKLEPDYVKVNRRFFASDTGMEYRMSALDGLLSQAAATGFKVIAQCVETEEESIRLLEAGVHLQQGYYYTRGKEQRMTDDKDPVKSFFEKIQYTYDRFRAKQKARIAERKSLFARNSMAATKMVSRLEHTEVNDFDSALRSMVRESKVVLGAFVLNQHGIQITNMERRGDGSNGAEVGRASFTKNSDHAIKEYFLYIEMGYEKFVTKPYLNRVGGQTKCIVSKSFFHKDGGKFVVCVEVPYPKDV